MTGRLSTFLEWFAGFAPASSLSGGVDIIARDGTPIDFLETGGVPLNCVFHDGDLLITDFGDVTEVPDAAPMEGRLWRVEVGVQGMPLYRGSIATPPGG